MEIKYTKLTKSQARKAFNAGEKIFLHTNKLSWNNPWQNPMPVTIDREQEKSHIELADFCKKLESENPNLYEGSPPYIKKHVLISEFDNIVNSYSYYNCDNERGNVVIYLKSIQP